MSVRYSGQTIVGPGNELYIGHNGNFFVGHRDLGIKAKSDVQIVTASEFANEYRVGLYYVVTPSPDGISNPTVTLNYIDERGNKIPIQSNDNVVIPTIGSNGNWFVNGTDTGKPSVIFKESITKNLYAEDWDPYGTTGLYYQNVSCFGMNAGDEISVKVDINPSNAASAQNYMVEAEYIIQYIANDGYMQALATQPPALTIPIKIHYINTSDFGSFEPGASIDDDNVNKTTTWSSLKIKEHQEEVLAKAESIEKGKNLEFTWSGTYLGVRQEGYKKYQYSNLKGSTGLCGIDGSSIVHAEVDASGHLIVSMQDTDAPIDTTKMLTLESGVVTGADLLDLQNSVNRLNNAVAALTTAPMSQTFSYNSATSAYETVVKLTGFGNIQFFSTKFTGSVKIIADSHIFIGTFNDLSIQSDNNLLVPSFADDTVKLNSQFTSGQNHPLNFVFEEYVELQIMISNNSEGLFPTLLIQGDYYDNTDYGESGGSGGGIIGDNSITEAQIDAAFTEIFGTI